MGCEFRSLGNRLGGWTWGGQGVLGKVLGRVDGGDMVGRRDLWEEQSRGVFRTQQAWMCYSGLTVGSV